MNKIISLRSENVKRLQAVFIEPSGNVVVIGGKNGAGKSSVLDSIEYALGGDPSAKMPVRRGEEKARVVLDLGDLIVKRTFTSAGGTSLVVTNADGVKQSTPQAILDKLVGKLTFDPLNFARQKPQQQAETMRALVGLDFTAHDAAHDKLFDERTAVNRHVKTLEAQLSGIPKHDVPVEEISGADILAEQQKASETNAANKDERDKLERMAESLNDIINAIPDCEGRIKNLEIELGQQRERLESLNRQHKKINDEYVSRDLEVAKLVDVLLDGFSQKLASVEETNRKIRSNVQRADLVKALKEHSENSEKMTSRLEKMDSDKRAATTNAKYPVEGLMFDASGGIILNGIPFEQCSAAEQLKVSIAVGFALNPKLRVLLVRDGSLLDEDSMNVLIGMAKEADAQVWVERVETDAHTSVVIEDGHIQGVEPEPVLKETEQVSQTPPENPAPEQPEPARKVSKLKRAQSDQLL